MIALLNCSMNLLGSEVYYSSPVEEREVESLPNDSLTGELQNFQDSVSISYDDLRIVNSKLIELKYTKIENSKLKTVVNTDSIIINKYIDINKNINKDCNKLRKQRNIALIVGTIGVIFGIIGFVK